MAILRHRGIRCMIFIDDLLLLASSQEELTRDREGSIHYWVVQSTQSSLS